MKTLLLLLLLATSILANAQVKNDLARQRLKGKIKMLTESDYDAGSGGLVSKNISRYDDNGNLLDFYSYGPDNALLSKSIYNYNDSGKLVDVKRYKGDGTYNTRTAYKYDLKGNEVEEDNYDASGILFMKARSLYNGNGTLRVCDRFNEYGILFLKSNYKNDDDGNQVEDKQYDSHHGLKFKTTYDYENFDANGNWLKRTTYKNDKPVTLTTREINAR
jgi:hypothetical protein